MNEVILSNKQINALFQSQNNYPIWRGTIKISEKENENVEEKLESLEGFFRKNKISVNENSEFTMYVVVDADDKGHEAGAIIYKENTETYTESRAYEDLKKYNAPEEYWTFELKYSTMSQPKKRKSIRRDLLAMEDKMFSVLVNKKDVSAVEGDIVFVNKYKVVEEIALKPVLKYKVESINDGTVKVILYNNLTEKSKRITLRDVLPCSLDDIRKRIGVYDDIRKAIGVYLDIDEMQVQLINSTVNGVEL